MSDGELKSAFQRGTRESVGSQNILYYLTTLKWEFLSGSGLFFFSTYKVETYKSCYKTTYKVNLEMIWVI